MNAKLACAVVLCGCTLASAAPVYRVIELPLRPADTGAMVEARAVFEGRAVGWSVGFGQAVFWPSPAAQPVDLTPAGFPSAFAGGIWGKQQAGYAELGGQISAAHAFLWSGSAASAVDLHPAGYTASLVEDVDGVHQAGRATVGNRYDHAMIWSGSAASARDLHPAGYLSSDLAGTDGEQHAGAGTAPAFPTDGHALFWDRTGAVHDLNPAGYIRSAAQGVSGSEQVGFGQLAADPAGSRHALLWRGTSASAVDLTPAGFGDSIAWDVSDGRIVGTANDGNFVGHAMLWTGTTANEFLDLNQFLPPSLDDAQAFGVDAHGNIVGSARSVSALTEFRPVMWVPVGTSVPLPPAAWPGLVALATAGAFVCRRPRP